MDFADWRPRVDRSRATAALAAGDLTVVGGLILYGTVVHHGVDPFGGAGRVLGVLMPFLLGWAVAAVATEAYADCAQETVGESVIHGVVAWVPAVVIGGALRATPWFPGNAPLLFLGVVGGFGLLAIVGWRVAAGLARTRLDRVAPA